MDINIILPDLGKTSVAGILDGQVFFAKKVGISGNGIYIKDNGAVWPIRNGRKVAEGGQFTSPSCPIEGYEPINFVF